MMDGGMMQPTQLTEPQVLEVARVINRGEVDEAQLALQHSTDADVRTFAQRMVTEHTEALLRLDNLTRQLGMTPAPSGLADRLETSAREQAATLGRMQPGAAFDLAYMKSQVDAHSMAASIADSVLMPQAQTPQLVEELRMERATIQQHLQQATELQLRLEGAGTGAGTPPPRRQPRFGEEPRRDRLPEAP